MNDRNARRLRRLASIAIAAALALPAAAAAGSRDDATLQNDNAHYGVPSSPNDGTTRNDQAHFGRSGDASTPINSAAPIVVRVDGGFDWISAGVGAAGGFGLALVVAASTLRRRPGVDPTPA